MKKQIPVPVAVFKNPKYRGKHILLEGSKVLAAGNWEEVSKIFDATLKKTKKVPTLAFIPKDDVLVM